jgi:hypothetical protein
MILRQEAAATMQSPENPFIRIVIAEQVLQQDAPWIQVRSGEVTRDHASSFFRVCHAA